MHSAFTRFVLLFSLLAPALAYGQSQTLPLGWSMVGNDSGAAIDVGTVFGNTTKPTLLSPSVTSVWSWSGGLNRWNFHSPSMTSQEIAAYTTSNGYGVLSSIAKGEGFWVNAKAPFVYNPIPSSTRFGTVGSYPVTDCVKDNSTGLTWEGKTTSGLRVGTRGVTNYDSTTELQISGSAVAPTQTQIEDVGNSIGYRNAVNASGLCGYSDWRLPSLSELQGLVVLGTNPSIDHTWFPNTVQYGKYWTSSPYVGRVYYAWYVSFSDGLADYFFRYDSTRLIRLVR